MNEMEQVLDKLEEMSPDLLAQVKENISERSKDGPVRILVVGSSDAGMMREVMKRAGVADRVEIVEQPERVRIDAQSIIDSLDRAVKDLMRHDLNSTVHDMVAAEAEVVEVIRPRKPKVKGFHSNSQFKQQRPAFKNQHQARAMIRPPRRGG